VSDLFTAAGVDLPTGPARRDLTAARKLLAEVEALADIVDEPFVPRCREVADRAERMGAHSVARACRWYAVPAVCDMYGWDHVEIKVERAARRYVERIERERLG
jgi:hypothetical protein